MGAQGYSRNESKSVPFSWLPACLAELMPVRGSDDEHSTLRLMPSDKPAQKAEFCPHLYCA
eukprot:3483796-Amphidinium_carterae.1